jgi:hypothetical protein
VAEGRGEDPVPHYEAAIAEHTRALTHDTRGETGPILVNRAKAAVSLGFYLLNQRRDPTAPLTAAIADFQRVRREFSGLTDADQFEADAHAGIARHLHRVAGDRSRPAAARDDAHQRLIAAYRRAVALDSGAAARFVELGGARVNYGTFLAAAKRDPERAWGQAIVDLGRALELDAAVPNGRLFRGNGHAEFARYLADTGRPFVEAFELAFADYAAALQQTPASREPRLVWAGALVDCGSRVQQAGRDGRTRFEEAIRLLDPAVQAAPDDAAVLRYRGLARTALLFNFLQVARSTADHTALAAGAKADLERAQSLHPAYTAGFARYLQAIDGYLKQSGR